MVTGDLTKGCFGITNQEWCDVCKMLIKDELTRKLDRYNDTKLKRMYRLTDQDMVQMYKLCSCLGFVRWECFWEGWMFVIVDRRIGRWFVKSLSENGIFLCACDRIQTRIQYYVQAGIWYKLWTRFGYTSYDTRDDTRFTSGGARFTSCT